MPNLIKSKYFLISALALVILAGAFLRSYNHHDWLHFELDQARDWQLIKTVSEEGAGKLPLLGPRSSGSEFRLGPVFYVFQYISAGIFGDGPDKLAYPELLFGILSIPLFYLFSREYFFKSISFALATMFSFSLFAIYYSRFSWNPNAIPFFTLLLFYSLLRLSREETRKKKIIWIIIAALALGITVQLHTLALVALPIIVAAYLLLTKTKANWKAYLAGALVFLIFVSPIIANDAVSGFSNTKAFFAAAADRQESQAGHTLAGKTLREVQELSSAYALIMSSEKIGFPIKAPVKSTLKSILTGKLNDPFEKRNLLYLSLLIAAVFIGFVLLAMKLLKPFAEERRRRNFIMLILIWQIIYFALFVPLAFKQAPRFYLTVIFIPFILAGVYLEAMLKIKKAGVYLAIALVSFFVLFNFFCTKRWFWELEHSRTEDIAYRANYILKRDFQVTLGQQEDIAAYVSEFYKNNPTWVEIDAPPDYSRAIKFILRYQYDIPATFITPKSRDKSTNFFYMGKTRNKERGLETMSRRFRDNFEIISSKEFGTFTVYHVKLKDSLPDIKLERKIEDDIEDDRYTWDKLF